MTNSSRLIQVALSVAVLTAVYLWLNARTLGWPFGIVDAPILIAQSILFSPIEYFTTPEAYNFLSYNNYTPLVTLSWDLDYTLFGVEPYGYRVHQLVSLALLLALVYFALLQLSGSVAVTTLFCFAVMNLPATYASLDVMVNRHYVEGMIFALLSFLAFSKYARSSHTAWLVLSVACYAVASTAKEVFLPLPGLLFFLLPGGFSRRVLVIAPFAIVLALYLTLRLYIIGGSGGYSGAADTFAVINNAGTLGIVLLQVITGMLAQPLASLGVLLIALVLIYRECVRQSASGRFAIAMGFIGVLLPLLALLPMLAAGFVISRWVFVPAIVLLLYLAHLCSQSNSKALPAMVYLIVLSSSAYAGYQRVTSEEPFFARGEGRSYQAILASEPERYLVFSRFSQLAAENYSVWVYIAKLRNGRWGTLPIYHPGQAPYHDLSGRTPVPMGRRARQAGFLAPTRQLRQDVVQSTRNDPSTGLLSIVLEPTVAGSNCSFYVFNEHNGVLFTGQPCREWVTPYRQLVFQLRKAGLAVENVQLAVWSDDEAHPWRSRAYSLPDLLQAAP